MTIDLGPELEAALKEAAERRGLDPQTLILETLRRDFFKPKWPGMPIDEWIAGLREIAIDCGVSLSDEDLSREDVRLVMILLDTDILIRLANTTDSQHVIASQAVAELARRGETLCLTPQVLIEFRSVATKPKPRGLGLVAAAADAQVARFAARFHMLDDTAGSYPAWLSLVITLGILGRQVHDARRRLPRPCGDARPHVQRRPLQPARSASARVGRDRSRDGVTVLPGCRHTGRLDRRRETPCRSTIGRR